MSLQVIAFGAGVILLAMAIIGGGFELKELKVPRLDGFARFTAAAAGVGLMFVGWHLANKVDSNPPLITTRPEPVAPIARPEPVVPISETPVTLKRTSPTVVAQSVPFLVRTYLSVASQSEEFTQVFIDGRSIGSIRVDVTDPNATLEVRVPSDGTYRYALQGHMKTLQGKTVSTRGDGEIQVQKGASFYVVVNQSDGSARLVPHDSPLLKPMPIGPSGPPLVIEPARRGK